MTILNTPKLIPIVIPTSQGSGAHILERTARQAVAYLCYFSALNVIRHRWRKFKGRSNLTVLAYHRVNDLSSDKSLFTVSTSRFEEQIIYIKKKYQVVTFSDALKMRKQGGETADALVITFDDGYQDNFLNALPILEKHGVKACFFIATDLIDNKPDTSSNGVSLHRFPGMNWSDLSALQRMGFEIGAHTCSHPNLLNIPLELVRREIIESKTRLEQELEEPIEYFAYPGGKRQIHYDDVIKDIVRERFAVCCTTTRGRNEIQSMDMLELHRICIQRWWSPFYFAREIEGTFDFVGERTLMRYI